MHLFGTLGKIHIHLSLMQIISKSHKMHFSLLNTTFFQPSNNNLFHLKAARSSLVVLSLG